MLPGRQFFRLAVRASSSHTTRSTWLNPRAEAASAAHAASFGELALPTAQHGGHRTHAPSSVVGQSAREAAELIQAMGARMILPKARTDEEAEEAWAGLAGSSSGVVRRAVEEVLAPLLHPEALASVRQLTRATGAAEPVRPTALLFHGPPGTGKTAAAQLAASTARVPLIACPLESLVSKWYGDGEKALAALFANCERVGRCVLFLDELDALGGNRQRREVHEASRRMLSVLLRHLDGMDAVRNVALIGATNRPTDLDAALVSRFELRVAFEAPDTASRTAIFARYAQHLPRADLESLGEVSNGLTGRDILSLCRQAERRFVCRRQLRHGCAMSGGGGAPPVALYEDALRERRDGEW